MIFEVLINDNIYHTEYKEDNFLDTYSSCQSFLTNIHQEISGFNYKLTYSYDFLLKQPKIIFSIKWNQINRVKKVMVKKEEIIHIPLPIGYEKKEFRIKIPLVYKYHIKNKTYIFQHEMLTMMDNSIVTLYSSDVYEEYFKKINYLENDIEFSLSLVEISESRLFDKQKSSYLGRNNISYFLNKERKKKFVSNEINSWEDLLLEEKLKIMTSNFKKIDYQFLSNVEVERKYLEYLNEKNPFDSFKNDISLPDGEEFQIDEVESIIDELLDDDNYLYPISKIISFNEVNNRILKNEFINDNYLIEINK